MGAKNKNKNKNKKIEKWTLEGSLIQINIFIFIF